MVYKNKYNLLTPCMIEKLLKIVFWVFHTHIMHIAVNRYTSNRENGTDNKDPPPKKKKIDSR